MRATPTAIRNTVQSTVYSTAGQSVTNSVAGVDAWVVHRSRSRTPQCHCHLAVRQQYHTLLGYGSTCCRGCHLCVSISCPFITGGACDKLICIKFYLQLWKYEYITSPHLTNREMPHYLLKFLYKSLKHKFNKSLLLTATARSWARTQGLQVINPLRSCNASPPRGVTRRLRGNLNIAKWNSKCGSTNCEKYW
jgi:hypothetical protein